MLSKSVIFLKKVITGSLKSKPYRQAQMVEYLSITPWMMFTSARLLKDHVYANRSLPSRCIVGTGFLKSSFNYSYSGYETRMQSILFHARRSSQVSAHRYLKRLRSAIRKSAEALDSLSVWLCCFKLDAIQIMQFCSLALNSPDPQSRGRKFNVIYSAIKLF